MRIASLNFLAVHQFVAQAVEFAFIEVVFAEAPAFRSWYCRTAWSTPFDAMVAESVCGDRFAIVDMPA